MAILTGDNWEVRVGSNLEILPTLPSASVHVCCTSPAYFKLRRYLPRGHPDADKEVGTENTPEDYTERMVRIFREVRRVLRDDGCLFVNLGDSYTGVGGQGNQDGGPVGHTAAMGGVGHKYQSSLPNGNLLNIPHRVAEALRADGWRWRQTIIWAKRSCMPESVKGTMWVRCQKKVKPQGGNMGGVDYKQLTERDGGWTTDTHPSTRDHAEWEDCPGCSKCTPNGGYVLRHGSGRCTTSHEYIFLMTKTNSYFWDSEASKEQGSGLSGGACFGKGGGSGARQMKEGENAKIRSGTRNPRSVWTMSSEPLQAKHYAAWPTELVRRCLLPSTSRGGCCGVCCTPLAPVVEDTGEPDESHKGSFFDAGKTGARDGGDRTQAGIRTVKTAVEYRPQCKCNASDKSLPVVLDPFCGSGRTGRVAINMGCRFIGLELNEEFAREIATIEIERPWKPKSDRKPAKKRLKVLKEQGVLF